MGLWRRQPVGLSARDNAIAVCLSVLLFAIYLLTYRGGFHSIDEVSMFAVTESMVKRGELDTNQIIWSQWTTSQREAQGFFGLNGDVYSKKGLAMSLFAMPFYGLALHVPGLGMLQGVSLLNAVITAVTGGLLYLCARRLAYSQVSGALLGIVFGLATTAWVYAKYLFSEPVAGWLLFMAFFFLLGFRQENRWPFLVGAGLAAGLSVVARANNALCLPLFGLYLLAALIDRAPKTDQDSPSASRSRLNWRWPVHLLIFVGAVLAAGSVMALYNWLRAGNALQTGYDLTIFSPALWVGLYKLLFSPLRGLFWFSPILLLSPIAFFAFFRRRRAEAGLTAGIVLINVLLFSAWTSGEGLSWGSRFLVPILPFAALTLVAPLQVILEGRGRLWLPAFVILGGVSVVVQLLGIAANPWLHLTYLRDLFAVEFLENTPALYAPAYSPIWGQVQQLVAWGRAASDVAWFQPWGIAWLPLGLALTLLALSVALLLWLLRLAGKISVLRSDMRTFRHVLAPSFLVLWAGLTALFTLSHYFTTDLQFGPPDDGLHRILSRLAVESQAGDGMVTLMPYHYHVPMNIYKPRQPFYGFAVMSPPLPDEGEKLLRKIDAAHDRLWLITSGVRPGESPNEVERWLARTAFKATDEWYDDFRLCLYASPASSVAPRTSEAVFGETIRLKAYEIGAARYQPGDVATVAFDWLALRGDMPDYTVFIHLIGPDGRLAAQQDSAPVDGFEPTSTWPLGVTIRDQHGLLLPPDLTPGQYALWVGLYDGVTGKRLPVRSEQEARSGLTDGTASDYLVLGAIEVE